MSEIYSSLQVSPRKKRSLPDSDEEEIVLTPKRARTSLLTPPSTGKKSAAAAKQLPDHLTRLYNTQTALQNALAHSLATCPIAPTSNTGQTLAVLNHITLATYAGLSTRFDSDELRRLCWLWEWNGKALAPQPASSVVDDEEENPFLSTPKPKSKVKQQVPVNDDEENPFLDVTPKKKRPITTSPSKPAGGSRTTTLDDYDNPFLDDDLVPFKPKEWVRGGMGILINATSHYAKGSARRIPAYGIGIEIDTDDDLESKGGMYVAAKWMSRNEERRKEIHGKLQSWVELHGKSEKVPPIPMADLPELAGPAAPSELTRKLASASPKSPASMAILQAPASPSRSPTKSPLKRLSQLKPFVVPFPVTSTSSSTSPVKATSPTKSSLLFPKTPSNRKSRAELAATLFGSRTPSSSPTRSESSSSVPSTPVHQRGSDAATAPSTPSSSRRQALEDRIRQKSLMASPTKILKDGREIATSSMSRDELLKMTQEETRRRCLLGRLDGVAQSIWMLFSAPGGSAGMTPTMRKRRMLPYSEVCTAVVKSSPVPISYAEAQESLGLLTSLCPFFLKSANIGGEDWLEMPAETRSSDDQPIPDSPTKPKARGGVAASPARPPPSPTKTLSSPSRRQRETDGDALGRSPRHVKNEGGGLRQVRERIRRELEMQE